MVKIYQTVYEKICRLTQNQIIGAPLTQPLSAEVTSLFAAKAAYKKAYDAIDGALTASMIAAIKPELEQQLEDSGCAISKEFTAAEQKVINERRQFLAMQAEKNRFTLQHLAQLQNSFSGNKAQLQLEVGERECAETAIASVHHKIHNCISISTWVEFELLTHGIASEAIERFHKPITANGIDYDAHAFVVVNRKPGSAKTDMTTWGEDCYIIDPWYGYWGKAIDLANDPKRFQNYYLIVKLNDKKPTPCAYSKELLSGYINRMNTHIPKTEDKIPTLQMKNN